MTRQCAFALLAILLSASARAEDTAAPVIEHTPVVSAARGSKWVQLFAKVTDESKVFPQVFFRYGPGVYQKPLDMKAVKGQKNQFGVNVPVKGDVLEYYLEAYDELGNGPGRSGDPDRPWHVDTSGNPAVAQPSPMPRSPGLVLSSAEAAPPGSTRTEPASPAATAAVRPTPAPARTADSSAGGGRFWTWVVGGAGVGILAGGVVAAVTFKTADDAYQQRLADDPSVFPSLKAQYDANKSLGRDATILMIAGGALVATGAVLYFFEVPRTNDRRVAEAPKHDFAFGAAPIDGGGAAALAGRF
jgi:hypothetical protein